MADCDLVQDHGQLCCNVRYIPLKSTQAFLKVTHGDMDTIVPRNILLPFFQIMT